MPQGVDEIRWNDIPKLNLYLTPQKYGTEKLKNFCAKAESGSGSVCESTSETASTITNSMAMREREESNLSGLKFPSMT
jgi:hypothetical protein